MLLGSSLQKQFAPLDGFKQQLHFDFLSGGLSNVFCVLVTAVEFIARFCAVEHLGATRVISILLPSDSLVRAHRAGFISTGSQTRFWIASAVLLGIFLDLVGTETSKLNVIIGYLWLAISILTSPFKVLHETNHVYSQFFAGLLLSVVGVATWSLGLLAPPSGQILLESLAVIASIVASAWTPTQPRAISTALKLVWPLVVVLSVFVSLNFSRDSVPWESVSLVILYYALFTGVKSSSIASSSQSAANVIPSSRVVVNYGGYYINEVLKDKESRDIFYFLLLNLSFMVVQMLYGIWTNSLGLISDSIHMLFDCLALAVGLVAAVMSKWPASRAHPFGFAKVEIISGFANSIFLVLISISIMIEAVERLMEPPEMTTDQLLLISTLGLGVNLVGIFAFNHGHHHGHGHDHGDTHAIKSSPQKSTSLPTIQTPRSARPGSGDFDHMMGLSPRPDFSNFAGFNESDTPRRDSLTGLGLQIEPLGLISENTFVRSRRAPGASSPSRSRSPVRRIGSPFKTAHEPSLDDVNEDDRPDDLSKHIPESLEVPSKKFDHGPNHGDARMQSHQEKGPSTVREFDHKKHDSTGCDSHSLYADAQDHPQSHLDSHSHSHLHLHSHSHSHSHDDGHTHGHKHAHGHGHGHGHSHSPGHSHDHSHNMEGIFLHILADTLGSAGVIVSTLLIRMFGWTGFDPLASIFIAVLIFLSVVPLLKSSFGDLLLTLQDDQEYTLREILGEVSLIKGVFDIPFIRFWVDGNGLMHGILTIRAGLNGDLDLVRGKVKQKLLDGVDELSDVIVQVDRAE